MGKISEMIIDGILCQKCGCLMEDLIVLGSSTLKKAPGYPRTCSLCQSLYNRPEFKRKKKAKVIRLDERRKGSGRQ